MAGKGDTPRPVDAAKWDAGYEKAFGKAHRREDELQPIQVWHNPSPEPQPCHEWLVDELKIIQVFGATLEGAERLQIGGKGWSVNYTSHTLIKEDPGVMVTIRPHLVVHLDPPPKELEEGLPGMCTLHDAPQVALYNE